MTDGPIAVDTSVAVAMLLTSHEAHQRAAHWAGSRRLALCGHAVAETYSVLTRLPGDARLSTDDAVALIEDRFEPRGGPPVDVEAGLPRTLAGTRIAGGAVYDAVVALAAVHAGLPLATRGARARTTYEAVGVRVEIVD